MVFFKINGTRWLSRVEATKYKLFIFVFQYLPNHYDFFEPSDTYRCNISLLAKLFPIFFAKKKVFGIPNRFFGVNQIFFAFLPQELQSWLPELYTENATNCFEKRQKKTNCKYNHSTLYAICLLLCLPFTCPILVGRIFCIGYPFVISQQSYFLVSLVSSQIFQRFYFFVYTPDWLSFS